MYKNGDKVLVKATVEKVTDDYVRIYAEGYGERSFSLDNAPVEHKTYSQGLADAWKLAKKIVLSPYNGGMSSGTLDEIFDKYSDMDSVLMNYTAEEALAKIEAYEKERAEVKIGDEVVHGIGGCETKFIVTSMSDGMIRGFDSNGITHSFTFPNRFITKTGKHIEIESLLKQIGE